MCRWFAYISPTEECLLEDVLITPKHSLARQVHDHYLPELLSHDPATQNTTQAEITTRNRLFNVDGFGLAIYTTTAASFSRDCIDPPIPHPTLYKNAQPPLHDLNFRSLCANTSTLALFAHIRAATTSPVVPVNNHPFAFGRYAIMHNGFISSFTEIRRSLSGHISDAAYAHINGSTDTEYFAALFMTELCGTKASPTAWEYQHPLSVLRAALERTIKRVINTQRSVVERPSPNDLNVAITDGACLIAVRFRNHATQQPPSLYVSETAGVTMNRKFPGHADGTENEHAKLKSADHGKHVIIASEPSTYKVHEWTLVPKNSWVEVDAQGKLSRGELDIEKELYVDGTRE